MTNGACIPPSALPAAAKCPSSAHDRLSAQPRSRRNLFLHRQSARPQQRSSHTPCRRFARVRPPGSCPSAVPYRCLGGSAGPHALPPDTAGGDADFPDRWRAIKAGFSLQLAQGEPRSASRIAKGERGIWQRRFWEHTIRDDRDYAAHMDYVHVNPVTHGLVSGAAGWPYSSFRRCVERGLYPKHWCAESEPVFAAGERAEL